MKKFNVIFIKRKFLLFAAILIIAILTVPIILLIEMSSSDTFTDPKSGVIVIDPGHGGIDGGTSRDGVLEKEINLDIAKKLQSILVKQGYKIIMTREEDVSLESLDNSQKSRHMRDLTARANIINNSNAQLFLSIHVNCNLKKPATNGAIVFFSKKYEQNKTLALCIQRQLNNMVVDGKKRSTHDPVQAKYYVLDYTDIPGVIVETGFISNEEEKQELVKDSFRQELAKSISKGVEQYLNESSKVSTPAS
ncbi:N-acetylmuramoyl-L-alanine amidase family protein [Ruminiclostridium papyrosolvens]|uniref:Cell wall hydrolase n=1 Tax=Ruminiclostridium papyrosolvens C7 TaxID=1330534 RepID=U4R4Q6_9FIRM|nr:N-acetylmuramoyl-L-alanine amidase [Ruminiclostridium papyrosolvens]EPR13552.1 cell wall hydrolase [Ruminiclostridium papyrosolvens C7]